MEISQQKDIARRVISTMKKTLTEEDKIRRSEKILKKLESNNNFIKAKNVLFYYSLPDEVRTDLFINKWYEKKNIFLPVVSGDKLLLRKYDPGKVKQGYKSIMEPYGTESILPDKIDVAVIPGVAFDIQCNRLGRGKGFYDRLLADLKCDTIGLAYDFQIFDLLPVDSFDKNINEIISESGHYVRN